MLFKNFSVYRMTSRLDCTEDGLKAALAERPFHPCGSQDWHRKGFVPPVERSEDLTISMAGKHLIALRIQEKVLPAAAVQEALAEKIAEIEARDQRVVGRKERRRELKEQVTLELLPRALTKSKVIYGYIDIDQSLLAVDTATPARADIFIGSLRDALGSLPVIPMETQQRPEQAFASWILDGTPKGLELIGSCVLSDPQTRAKVGVAEHDLTNEAFITLVRDGHLVEKISVSLPDECSFTVSSELRFSKVKFDDQALMAGRSEDGEGASDVARADFMLLQGTVARTLALVLNACGGEVDKRAEASTAPLAEAA